MKNFNSFMFAKTLDRLAERCVREKLPIVEFVQWYIEEGQYLHEGFWGDVGSGAATGGGYGALAGTPFGMTGVGAGVGAGLGALYGGAKNLYNRFAGGGYNTTKQQALDALQKFAQLSPRHGSELKQMINTLSQIQPSGSEADGGVNPEINPGIEAKRQDYRSAAAQKTTADALKHSLGSFLNDDVIGNLAYNKITPDKWKAAYEPNKGLPTDEAIEKTLADLRIVNRAGGAYKYNASTGHFEHVT